MSSPDPRRGVTYIWESGKPRRVMHIAKHNPVDGRPLGLAWCGMRHNFDRAINAPFALGRKVCRPCARALEALDAQGERG